MAMTMEEQIKNMYGAQLTSQKEQLKQDYEQNVSDLDAQQKQAQQALAQNINKTKVDAQRSAVNSAEINSASGLTSGARAQQRLARDNQLQADITALRTAGQQADAETERQRSLLAREYSSAITQAQADNDLAMAQALYEEAQRQEERLLAQQEEQAQKDLAAAQLMADNGDYSRLGAIYGYSQEELQKIYQEKEAARLKEEQAKQEEKDLIAAEMMAQSGDYSRLAAIYGLSETELQKIYQEAEEELLKQQQEEQAEKDLTAAEIMAQNGDFSRLAAIYGLSATELQKIYETANAETQASKQAQQQEEALAAAKLMANAGDYSRLAAIYGLSDSELKKLMSLSETAQETEEQAASGITQWAAGIGQNLIDSLLKLTTTEETQKEVPEAEAPMAVDMQSVIDLGYGMLNAEGLNELVQQGKVTETVEDGKLVLQKNESADRRFHSVGVDPLLYLAVEEEKKKAEEERQKAEEEKKNAELAAIVNSMGVAENGYSIDTQDLQKYLKNRRFS